MPCYLLTYHAYGSWLPDREQGFVHWQRGLQPQSERLAETYREQMVADVVEFDHCLERILLAEVLRAMRHQRFRFHAAATETAHLHVLLSWVDDRAADLVSDGVKQSLTRRLNKAFVKRTWLAKGRSRRRVKDRAHFDRLKLTYLPSHSGWKWDDERGAYL